MEQYPFFSIIIPTKNEESVIGNCLSSLKRLNYPKDRFEIIISDGLSSDNTVKIAEDYGAIIIRNEKQTVAPGRNAGFLNSRGDLIAFSDADCVMDENWLNNSLKYFKDNNIGGIGGPNFAPKNESSFGKAVRFLLSIGSFLSFSFYVTDSKKVKEAKSIPGCNAIYKRAALEKVIPTDESLLTCDDTDMNYHLGYKGYKLLYVPDVIVWHYRRDNPKKLWKQIYRFAVGRLQLSRKHKKALNSIHIISGFILPIGFLLAIILFFLNPVYLLFLTYSILAFLTFIFILSLIKERSVKVSLYVIPALIISVTAWSIGFIRELFFPIKEVSGK